MTILVFIIAFQVVVRRNDLRKIEVSEATIATGPLGEVPSQELLNGDLAAAGQIYKSGKERDSIRIEGDGENIRVLKFNTDPTQPAITVEMDRQKYLQRVTANHSPHPKAEMLPNSYYGVPVVRGGKRR
ncbi:MAG: hypothetical protein Q8L47_04485 [bacterium]|nr:hypothetical protein [bacterium]